MVLEQGASTTIPDPQSSNDQHWNEPSFWNEAQSASIQQHWEDIAVPNSSTVAELPLMANSQFAQQSAHHRLPINKAERQPWIEFDPLASSVDSR